MTGRDQRNHDQQDRFDRRVRALYQDAASTLTPPMLGRLRAARRTASTRAGSEQRHPHKHRSWPTLPVVAAVAAAVFAVAIGLRWQLGNEAGVAPPEVSEAQPLAELAAVDPAVIDQTVLDHGNPQSNVVDTVVMVPDAPDPASMDPPAPDATLAGVPSEDEAMLLMLEEDPDFYLWLGSDNALPANLEPSHDPT